MNNYRFTFTEEVTMKDAVDHIEHWKKGDTVVLYGNTPMDALLRQGYNELQIKQFTWMKLESSHVVTDLQNGAFENPPAVFRNEEDAGVYFQSLIMKHGSYFAKDEKQTWEEYRKAWNAFYESDEYPHDTMDFEIHWYQNVAVQ